MKNPPKVIFTTAYSEYAVEGFKLDAIDYLLKPIGYSDFLKAAEKTKEGIIPKSAESAEIRSDEKFLFIRSEYKILRINLDDIKYIESMREYLRIHIENQPPFMALMSMKKMEKFSQEKNFMRVQRSFIVHLSKITTIERNRIIFDKKVYISISDQYKEKFQEFLDNNFLT